jgi:hypothetical protein
METMKVTVRQRWWPVDDDDGESPVRLQNGDVVAELSFPTDEPKKA